MILNFLYRFLFGRKSSATPVSEIKEMFAFPQAWHRVTVTFDLTAPDLANAIAWLKDNLPERGPGGDNDEVFLRTWWISDSKTIEKPPR